MNIKANKISFTLAICACFVTSALAQLPPPGGGGTSTSNWQITYERDGTDTFTFPQWDATQNAYRMVTNTHDWKTNLWTLDGVAGQPAGFPEASWNTPTAYTGLAESKGDVKVKVKWIGSGVAPDYMFLTLDSSATSGERSILAGASCTGSNGQGDIFFYTMPTGVSHGAHAKRLKLDSSGEAKYKISLNAKATKTGTYADLKAYTGVEAGLEPKAISLFLETYKRVETTIAGGLAGAIDRDPAWTGEVETEEAEVSCGDIVYAPPMLGVPVGNYDPAIYTTGSLQLEIPVKRIGLWDSVQGTFTSSIDTGTRYEYYPPTVVSITANQNYSGEDLKSMRESPKVFTLNVSQTDSGSLIPGPFTSKIKVSVWAPERILNKAEFDHDEIVQYMTLVGGAGYQDISPTEETDVTVATTTTNELNFEVSLTGGISGTMQGIGVKADCGFKLGYKHAVASYGGSTTHINHPPYPAVWHRVKFKVMSTAHYMKRELAAYGSSGYVDDYEDTIENSSPPTIGSQWDIVPL